MQTGTIVSLAIYFIAMLGIGFYAWRKSTSDIDGYVLGGRSLGPGVTALSAGAADMSGWLMLGLPGAMFAAGLSKAWIGVGLFIGAFINWLVVAPRLRDRTVEVGDALTIPDYFGKRFPNGVSVQVVSSAVIIIFFTLYTASGLVAGGKLFDSAFGESYRLGLFLTGGVVVAYTLFGGFLAVSLTDFVQGCIMFVAMIMVPIVAMQGAGGWDHAGQVIRSVDPTHLSLLKGVGALGLISSLAWGLGYFGQPHIIVRFMAIRSRKDIPTSRNIGMSWMFVTLVGSLSVGLAGLAYATENNVKIDDPETIFIVLSDVLFNPWISGFLLAAILAAVMSTISSQLLVSSSSLVEDYYRRFLRRDASQKELVLAGRIAVLVVALIALAIAWNPGASVLNIVSYAWAGFGAAFGPLVILSLTWDKITRNGALVGMILGAVTVGIWIALGWSDWLYEIVPGFVIAWVSIWLVSILEGDKAQTIQPVAAE
ncbi:proline transporter OpuE [Stakelama sediminis]|uniref:Sodium/proline symporter n=1 Tax=Stakelama sediminis TaxID=463200 RepID=A0A840YYS6_9SPHN|nr:sodium/proline symporter PutP [Stakelama sediminis]MBB5718666.1 SSS family solute:Na+ symporter/sodium/proline symporter [Stakelama sediminis]